MSERYDQVERAIRTHVAAFNARDLQRLLTGLAEDAIWSTSQDTVCEHGELAVLFDDAFRSARPRWLARKQCPKPPHGGRSRLQCPRITDYAKVQRDRRPLSSRHRVAATHRIGGYHIRRVCAQ
jgi:hypothetical protein